MALYVKPLDAETDEHAEARGLAEIGDDVQDLGVSFEQLAGFGDALHCLGTEMDLEGDRGKFSRAVLGIAAAIRTATLAGQQRACDLGLEVSKADPRFPRL